MLKFDCSNAFANDATKDPNARAEFSNDIEQIGAERRLFYD